MNLSLCSLIEFDSNAKQLSAVTDISSVNSDHISAVDLLIAANRFGIDSLSTSIELSLAKRLSLSNVCNYSEFSDYYSLPVLWMRSMNFLTVHFYEIEPAEFSKLPSSLKDRIRDVRRFLGSHEVSSAANL